MAARKTKRRWEFGDPDIAVLTLDAEELLGFIDEKVESQMAFATSLALNLTGKDAVSDMQRRLPGSFTIRNRFTERGIVMQPSSKKDLVAKVGSIRSYMRLQALGGDRRGTKSSTRLVGVPHAARPSRSAKTTLAKMPSRIVAKGGWIGALRYPMSPGVWKIKGGKKRKRQKMVLMYSMHSKVRVQKVWDFARQVERVLQRRFETHAKAALERALKTAKKKRRRR